MRIGPKSDKVLTVRLPQQILDKLDAYCKLSGQTKTAAVYNWINSLPESDENVVTTTGKKKAKAK